MAVGSTVQSELDSFMTGLERRNPGQAEFHQAVREVAETLMPLVVETPEYRDARILERLTEPDRIVSFRVTWIDDEGSLRVNRAWRVQFNNAIGPYKGGMRFHSSVTESVLKFLGFEQIFKNSLTSLPMGGAKGGANFNPKGKSDREVMRFCQSLMTELHNHIGADTDVPAGDIGVGAREIGFLFGQYKRLDGRFTGALTGKGLSYGGSLVRTESTGYGVVYFLERMLEHAGLSPDGRTAVVSGSGNVALYAIEKLNELGVRVIAASDSGGFVHDPDGIDGDKLEWLKDLKENRRGRIEEYAQEFGCDFHAGERPWKLPCDFALPSATQNDIDEDDASTLADNGAVAVVEGANMPTTPAAVHALQERGVMFAPGKAANAGGVAVSGLEQSQNAERMSWTREEVDTKLREIIAGIHGRCVEHGEDSEGVDYVVGANRGGFQKVAEAMLAQGAV